MDDLRKRLKSLSQVENLIVDAQLTGAPFIDLEGDSLQWATDQIIVRTATAVGCTLPATDFFSQVTTEELSTFIKTMGYGDLTLEEVFLAIRLNTKVEIKFPAGLELEPVKFTAYSFSVDFVARVLSNYMQLRNLLDRKFQNLIDGHE